jgi:hypothetical protein
MGTPLATSIAKGKSSMLDCCSVTTASSSILQALRWNRSAWVLFINMMKDVAVNFGI